MKKHLLTLVIIVLAAGFASCGGSMFGVKLTDQKSVDNNLRQRIEKAIGADALVTDISLFPIDHFKESMDLAQVEFYAPGEDEKRSITVYISGGAQDPKENKVSVFSETRTKTNAVRLSDIDFSGIAANLVAAKELLAEEDYDFSGVAGYDIELDSDPSKVLHKFRIESREGSKMTTKGGRLSNEISYWEFSFVVDAEGNIEVID